ncbi:MAG: hypothetical protein IKJ01_01755 [Lachnospiraceae bacterium]|nr:hypothetical protein [Lachnospiraceae bacterium]
MKGKNFESRYLITRLFSTDYFHYYSSPAFFSAYFFPFVAFGKNRAYLDSEFNEKLNNIKKNKHGNFYNYATQGFGNVAFCESLITFSYFYNKLCSYEKDANKYFKKQLQIIGLESKIMRDDIEYVLSKEDLLLKRDMLVPEYIKLQLKKDLEIHENKYVLAELLFYIVTENHILPNVIQEKSVYLIDKLNLSENLQLPNVFLGFRRTVDGDIEKLQLRLLEATTIQILCLNGVTLFDKEDSMMLRNLFEKNRNLKMEVIISQKESEFYLDASEYQMNYEHLTMSKIELGYKVLIQLDNERKLLNNNRIFIKTTDKNIPYSLFIVQFNKREFDYIKVDLYSPFIRDNNDRPSMYIFRDTNIELFEHFRQVFDSAWKSDRYSKFYQ